MEDFQYGMDMEWKKIACMEYGKIVFRYNPFHALLEGTPLSYSSTSSYLGVKLDRKPKSVVILMI